MAKKLNILPTTLYKYEREINSPNVEMLIKLADFFNVSIDTLVGRQTSMIDVRFLTDIKRKNLERLINLTPEEDIAIKGYLDKLFEDRPKKN